MDDPPVVADDPNKSLLVCQELIYVMSCYFGSD